MKKSIKIWAGFVFMLSFQTAFAGMYLGAENDHNDTSLFFIGAQTEDPLFISIFLGDLEYQYLDGNTSVKIESTIVSPMVGYRFDGPVSASVAVGVTWTEEKEIRGNTESTDRETGAAVQTALSYWQPEKNAEFLASYNDATDFVWSRIRGKHLVREQVFIGAEVFWMGNNNFRSQGVGALLEIKGKKLSGLLKVGVSDIKNGDSGTYGGIEFSIPF